ncbi:DgyrCDS2055 [Dimorphilus gyrociliatus]|uniref:DgyrCDS2055 n=1 Tax=Dimorphilus gyrociliatus TaxID=2664684 RepID=A0A7I8VAF4_9ANNE|nr:DgyrCDS2055 [Dimorphilus gyrociliatus]
MSESDDSESETETTKCELVLKKKKRPVNTSTISPYSAKLTNPVRKRDIRRREFDKDLNESSLAKEIRNVPGRPSFKSPEDYYDDIIALKKKIKNLNEENSIYKLKLRRLEEENNKKEKEIDQLLNPNKNQNLRRTLGDRKSELSSLVYSLKQKIFKLETKLKEKETLLNQLHNHLKTTTVEELQIERKVFLEEIQRLRALIDFSNQDKNNMKQISLAKKTAKLTVNQNLRLREENLHLGKEIGKLLSGEEIDQEEDEKIIHQRITDGPFRYHQNVIKRLFEEKEHFKRKYEQKRKDYKLLKRENESLIKKLGTSDSAFNDNTVELLQSTMRGHVFRKTEMSRKDYDDQIACLDRSDNDDIMGADSEKEST